MADQNLYIYYFAGTHWDREWYQSFQGFRYRLVEVIDELIEVLEKNPDFEVFHLDGQTIVLEDYIEIAPENEARLRELVHAGRITVGPWYVMPDEFLLSGEALIKNLTIGHQLAQKWGAGAWKCGYVCDIFGHIAQTPQIFAGFGISHAVLGRGTNEHTTPAHFRWRAPDGTECTVFKLQDFGGYGAYTIGVIGWGRPELADANLDEETRCKAIAEHIEHERARSPIPVVLLMDGIDHEPVHVEALCDVKRIRRMYPEAKVLLENILSMWDVVDRYAADLPVRCGEINETAKLPGPHMLLISNTLSSRYPLKQENDRCQTLLEKWAEPMTIISGLTGYPVRPAYLEKAWQHLVQNHPHDSICGCSIDQVHKDMQYRFSQTREIAETLLEHIFEHGKPQKTPQSDFREMIQRVWNPLLFPRRETITVDIPFPVNYPCSFQEPMGYEMRNSFRIFDHTGREIPYGLESIHRDQTQRSFVQGFSKVDIYTLSYEVDLPAAGYAEYKIVPSLTPSRYFAVMQAGENWAENEHLRFSFSPDGSLTLEDKCTGFRTEGLLSYLDDGEIGDGWFHSNPIHDRQISPKGSPCVIERTSFGPSRVAFMVIRTMTVPARMDYTQAGISRSLQSVPLVIRSEITLEANARYLDIRTTIDNQACDHRLRLILPTGIPTDWYSVNQAFAFVTRQTGRDLNTHDWKEPAVVEKQTGGIIYKRHPDGTGLAFISEAGLHESAAFDDTGGTLAITLLRAFGKTFLTNGEEGGQIQGKLDYRYRLMPLRSEDSPSLLIRLQDELATGIRSDVYPASEDALLQWKSYFHLESERICASILKRSRVDPDGVVVLRVYNPTDSEAKGCFNSVVPLTSVKLANMLENPISSIPFRNDGFDISLEPWKIATFLVGLREQ